MNKTAIILGLFVVVLIFTTACSKKTEQVTSERVNQANPEQVRFCLTSYRGWVMTNRVLDELSGCLLSR